ncbi:MAG TPA: multiheme c-type cytochrome [Kofleriaceae bacterium]
MAKRKRRPAKDTASRSARTASRPASDQAKPVPVVNATKPVVRSRWPFAAAGLVLVAGIVVYVVLAHRPAEQHVATAAPPPRVIADAAVPVVAAPKPPSSTYIGSEQCGDCHEKEYAGWKKSWHARALATAKPKAIVGNFANAHYAGSSTEAWMKRKGGVSTMRTRGADGELADFTVDYVIGGKRMQDDVTVFPDGRWQVLPVYFHVGDRSWVDYTEAKQGALSPEHPFYWTNARRMANHECLDCHTTALQVAYDEATRKWTTAFIDGNVACENCHGPGSRHAETSEKADIIHPVDSGEVGMSACARCHGPRRPLFPLLDVDHQFRLGDNYDELYDPIVVTMPDGTSPDFFVDGKPKTSSFEYQAMLQSECYRKGKANCLTCHTAPHDPKHRHAELRANPDELCGKCHEAIRSAGTAHTHHKTASCMSCHMAPIVSGVLDHFADHSIDVPVPENTSKHGVPNACGVCHPKKTADDLAQSLATWWPDAHVRQARRERLADAFDSATARDSLKPLLAVIADTAEAPTLRGAACVTLGRRGGPRAIPVLVPLLDDPNVILRVKAAEALADAKATNAADALAKHLGDRSLRARLAIALALHDLHDARGDTALQQLADDPASSHLMIPHLELGQAAGARKDWAVAKRELEWVAKLSPYYADAIVQLGAVEHELGNDAGARARAEQALQLEPKHQGALALRGMLPP